MTKKQEIFVKEYLDTGNGTQSALKAYNTEDENTAAVIAWENLRKPKIQEAIQDSASIAQSIILELAQTATNETVKLNASKDILDRAGFKPVDKQELYGKDGKDLFAKPEDIAIVNKALDNI